MRPRCSIPSGLTENTRVLREDPRFIIGRLAQALTALLSAEIPEMDATARMLGHAIEDAVKYRSRTCPQCPAESVCAKCWADWQLAAAYEGLALELGVIADDAKPPLRAVGSGQ